MQTAVVAYIPALHRGYIDFLKKYPGTLFLLGSDLVLDYPRMERDIRALSAEEVKTSLLPFNIFSNIQVLSKDDIKELDKFEKIIMPDEDLSREFVDRYVSGKNVSLIPTFLRWDGHNAQKTNNPTNPDRLISIEEFDREIMKKIQVEADKSSDWWRQIGAAVVRNGEMILLGHNRPLPSEGVHNIFGDPRSNFDYGVSFELSKFLHAEAGLIAEAARRGIPLEGTSLYVTTFPCPVCAKSMAVAGVKKVYYHEGYSLLDAEDVLKTFGAELIQVKFD